MTDWLEWLLDEVRDEGAAEETLRLEVSRGVGDAAPGPARGQADAQRTGAEETDAPAAEDGPRPDDRRLEGTAGTAERAGAAWAQAAPVSSGFAGAETGEAGTDRERLDMDAADTDEMGAARTDDVEEAPEDTDGGLRLPRWRGTARRLADGETGSGQAVGRQAEDGTLPAAVRKKRARRTAADVPADGASAARDGGAAVYRRLLRMGRAETAARAGTERGGVYRQGVDAPSLTVDELDRAVRRDSRRYDGGMELY